MLYVCSVGVYLDQYSLGLSLRLADPELQGRTRALVSSLRIQ